MSMMCIPKGVQSGVKTGRSSSEPLREDCGRILDPGSRRGPWLSACCMQTHARMPSSEVTAECADVIVSYVRRLVRCRRQPAGKEARTPDGAAGVLQDSHLRVCELSVTCPRRRASRIADGVAETPPSAEDTPNTITPQTPEASPVYSVPKARPENTKTSVEGCPELSWSVRAIPYDTMAPAVGDCAGQNWKCVRYRVPNIFQKAM